MTLAERLSEYVRAAFSGHLGPDATSTTRPSTRSPSFARQNDWTLATWDIDRGLSLERPGRRGGCRARRRRPAVGDQGAERPGHARRHGDPGAEELPPVPGQRRDRPGPRHGDQPRASRTGPSSSILSPVVQIPVELERQFVVVEHDLPGRDQIEQIARSIATEPGDLPEGDDLGMVLDAAAGLTRMEAENAFSLSLVRHGKVVPETLWELKTGMLKKSGPADPAPGRRDLRRPGRPGCPEGVHQEGPGGSRKGSASGPGASCSWACRDRESRPSRRPWATRRAARRWSWTSARSWVRLGPDRGADPAGPQDRRCDGPLRPLHRRGGAA